jgi:hypothetical protein
MSGTSAGQKLTTDLASLVSQVEGLSPGLKSIAEDDQDAQVQATDAAASATAAANSATQAAASATAAAGSSSNASTYSSNALASQNSAASSASSASASATSANTSAANASSSAGAAATSATSASNNASTAMTNASAAAASATNAANSASAAATTVQNAIANGFLQLVETAESSTDTTISLTFNFTAAVAGKVVVTSHASSASAGTASDMVITPTATNATLVTHQQNWAGAGITADTSYFTVAAGAEVSITLTLAFSGTLSSVLQMISHLLFTPQ